MINPITRSRHLILLALAVLPALFFSSCSRQPQAAVGGDELARLSNVGKGHYEKGDLDQAAAAFQAALKLNPAHPDLLLNLANVHLRANQPDQAIARAQEVLGLDRNNAAAHYLIGCAQMRLGKADAALQSFSESQKIDQAVTALNFQLALAHERLGHLDEAIEELQLTVKFETNHPAAHYRLSQLLVRQGKTAEADAELKLHQAILARRPGQSGDVATYEKCKHTEIRLPFKLEQPLAQGVKVVFADATRATISNAAAFHGPLGVLDLAHDGRNSLFAGEGDGFRLLINSNGVFQPHAVKLPGNPGAHYTQCLVGDLNNDYYEDVVVLGDKGSHVFKFTTNAGITEVSKFANLKNVPARDGALVDLDFTARLGLILLNPDGNGTRYFRNLGSLYFSELNATSGLPATLTGARQIVVDDWNNDDLNDVLITRDSAPPLFFAKDRGGPLAATNTPPDWPAGTAIATGDLNNDLRPDLVIAAADKLEIIFGGMKEHLSLPAANFKVTSLTLLDYDNDGWLDILAAGDGLRVWRNLGTAGFRETTRELGLEKAVHGQVEFVAAADFDGDCDTDLVLSIAGQGLQLLRNDGGNANRQLKIRPIGTRSNASGLGIHLELNAGNWRTSRTVQKLPVEIGVGVHTNVDTLNTRWFDLAPSLVDTHIERCVTMPLLEIVTQPTGSCPYLYAWDGRRFRFVTDLLGASPVGLPLSDTRYIDADPEEYVWIGDNKMFPPRDGQLVLQVTEELREVLYLDEAKLVVVDHPAGTEVHTTGKLLPGKPFSPWGLVTLHQRTPLLKAGDLAGNDVTAALNEADGVRVSPAKLREPQLRGLAEPHGVVLDFGPLNVNRPLVLALTGWLRFGGGMANVAASHDASLPFPFPMLEVETSESRWQKVDVTVGAPAGKTKTILVDLNGKLPEGARRLRLTTAFEIHWDRIALFERRDNADTHITRLAPAGADLHWRGYSDMADLPWTAPVTPVYEQVHDYALWRITPTGWVTRYGDVKELIGAQDNALALVAGGDELTLSFPAAQLPTKPVGQQRDFFLWSVGWDKDSDFHVARGATVEPLPWHGMDDQRYGQETRTEFPSDALMQKHNTRWVGPYTLTRQK